MSRGNAETAAERISLRVDFWGLWHEEKTGESETLIRSVPLLLAAHGRRRCCAWQPQCHSAICWPATAGCRELQCTREQKCRRNQFLPSQSGTKPADIPAPPTRLHNPFRLAKWVRISQWAASCAGCSTGCLRRRTGQGSVGRICTGQQNLPKYIIILVIIIYLIIRTCEP